MSRAVVKTGLPQDYESRTQSYRNRAVPVISTSSLTAAILAKPKYVGPLFGNLWPRDFHILNVGLATGLYLGHTKLQLFNKFEENTTKQFHLMVKMAK